MSITKRMRFEVLRRDSFTCRYCGQSAPDVKLHVDHVRPAALGGDDSAENLVTACIDCNAGKASAPLDAEKVADVRNENMRWRGALEAAALDMEAETAAHSDRIDQFKAAFADEWIGTWLADVRIPVDWEQSLQTFCLRGLSLALMCDAVQITAERKDLPEKSLWPYFCGVCWNRIREIENRARQIMREESDEDGTHQVD